MIRSLLEFDHIWSIFHVFFMCFPFSLKTGPPNLVTSLSLLCLAKLEHPESHLQDLQTTPNLQGKQIESIYVSLNRLNLHESMNQYLKCCKNTCQYHQVWTLNQLNVLQNILSPIRSNPIGILNFPWPSSSFLDLFRSKAVVSLLGKPSKFPICSRLICCPWKIRESPAVLLPWTWRDAIIWCNS